MVSVILTVEGFVSLESPNYPGQHLGIRPDGSVKPPSETGTGEHGQFAVVVRSKVWYSPCAISHSLALTNLVRNKISIIKGVAPVLLTSIHCVLAR